MSIRFSDIAQNHSLSPDAHFDLAIGFVGPDLRSIRNLQDVFPRAEVKWAIPSSPCASDSPSESTVSRKIQSNVKKLKPSDIRPWDESTLEELIGMSQSHDDVREFHLYVDVSAFPRRMLARLLNAICQEVLNGLHIRLTLGYRLAMFSKPKDDDAPPNRRVAPVHPNMAGWPRLPGLPVHLVVGLGYERGKALGAVEYIQPAYLSLFTPESPEPKFAEQVSMRNKELLEGTQEESIYAYEVLDPAAQFFQLASMLASMRIDAKPVLLPFGPKIFFAMCALLSFSFSEVAVWHVSGEEEEAAGMMKPSSYATYIEFSLSGPNAAAA